MRRCAASSPASSPAPECCRAPEKKDDGWLEEERGELLELAIVVTRTPRHTHHEHQTCQPLHALSSQHDAGGEIHRPVAARPRPSWCPAAATAIAIVLTTSLPAQAQQTHSDKLLHAGASAAIVDAVWCAAALLEQPLPVRIGASVVVAAAAGIGKEGLDLAGFGSPDVADLLFDAFGIGLGVGIALVVEVLIARQEVGHHALVDEAPAVR